MPVFIISLQNFFKLDEFSAASARAEARILALERELANITKEATTTELLCSYLGRFTEKALTPPPPVKWRSLYF